jgi:uncharacterized RDD family membrane protein YckC
MGTVQPRKPDDPEASMTTAQQPDPFGTMPVALKGPSGPRAGFWLRFAAFFLDLFILLVPYIALVVVVGAPAAKTLMLFVATAYFALLESSPGGQTLGEKAAGIRVIDLHTGGSISVGRSLIRTLGRWVSFFVFGLGYLWMLWDPEKQTWHDKMGGAVMVPVRAYPIG